MKQLFLITLFSASLFGANMEVNCTKDNITINKPSLCIIREERQTPVTAQVVEAISGITAVSQVSKTGDIEKATIELYHSVNGEVAYTISGSATGVYNIFVLVGTTIIHLTNTNGVPFPQGTLLIAQSGQPVMIQSSVSSDGMNSSSANIYLKQMN